MPDLDGISLHRTKHLARSEVTRHDSILVTSVARTVVDLSGGSAQLPSDSSSTTPSSGS
jgi:hypothetical protein